MPPVLLTVHPQGPEHSFVLRHMLDDGFVQSEVQTQQRERPRRRALTNGKHVAAAGAAEAAAACGAAAAAEEVI